MNGHTKRTIQTLEALGFNLDEELSHKGVWVYCHPNAPDMHVKVFSGLSEIAAKKVRNRADQIIGLSHAGERIPESIAENARIKRREERSKRDADAAHRARELAPFQVAADERAARLKQAAAIERQERHDAAIQRLMGARR